MSRFKQVSLLAIGMVLLLIFLVPCTDLNAAPPTPTANVLVVNPFNAPALTRDVDNPAFQPFQRKIFQNLSVGSPPYYEEIVVPESKRLVIEFVSVYIEQPAGPLATVSIYVTDENNDEINTFFVPTVKQWERDYSSHIKEVYIASQPMRIYAGPGEKVRIRLGLEAAVSSINHGFSVGISGYYVNLP